MFFYVYRITDLKYNMFYIGSRQSNNKPLDDLGVKYLTSSNMVQNKIRARPADFRYKIVFLCISRSEAYRLENKLQIKLNVAKNPRFYNKIVCSEYQNHKKGGNRRHSDETKEKLSLILKERMENMSKEERSLKFGNFGVMNPMIRDGGHSEKNKIKMSLIKKQEAEKNGPEFYKKMACLARTPEAKKKRYDSLARPFIVTFKDKKIEFSFRKEFGSYLGLSTQMGARLVKNPHLWEKYNIINIEMGKNYENKINQESSESTSS